MSLYKRGDWYWADFTVDGDRFQISLQTTDWRHAVEKEREATAEAREGKRAASTPALAKLKLWDAVKVWLAQNRARWAENTYKLKRDRLKQVEKRLGQVPLRRLTPEQLREYAAARAAEKVSNRTVNLEVGTLLHLLRDAKLRRRFVDEWKPLPERSDSGCALTPEEKLRLISAAKQRPEWDNARLAMALTLNTTMRAFEIRGLQWRDVDFLEKEILVRKSKTQAGERAIPLNSHAWAAILELRERAKVLCGDNLSPEWYVFPHAEGKSDPDPTQPMKSWRTAWRHLTQAAGLPGLRFHDLRHHAITELAESTTSDGTIMALAGHVSKRMLEHYSHIRREAKRRAVKVLARSKLVGLGEPSPGVTLQSHVTNGGIKGSRIH